METIKSRFQSILAEESQEFQQNLEAKVAYILQKRHLTVASAESITAGLIAYRLTTQPGSSSFYSGGVTCYSARAKVHQLGILPKTIAVKGEVSAEVATAMAEEIRRRLDTDLGLSATGFAGPAVSDTEKVGLVFIGLATRERSAVHQFLFDGDRDSIRRQTADAALGLLYFEVEGS
ncbi:MAG: CinA family protein [Candidatus Margulisiibacteriota bacterium]